MTEEILITEESTIPQVLKAHIALHPDWEILVEREERLTYKEFGERVDRLAAGLHQLGVQPGEKVAMILPNGIMFPVIFMAVCQIGAVSVAVNPTLRAQEFKHILNDSESVAVIVVDKVWGMDPKSIIRDIRAELPHLRYLIVDGEAAEGEYEYNALAQQTGADSSPYQPVPDDLVSFVYTSGTTGLPKGTMHSHRTMLASSDWMILPAHMVGSNITVMYTPPPFTGAGVYFTLNSILYGRKNIMQDRFMPYEAIQLIEKEKVDIMGATPQLAMFMARNPDLHKHDTSSLIYFVSGGSVVPEALVQEIREKLGCPTMIIFGLTEAFRLVSTTDPFTDPDWAQEKTIGKVSPDYEVKIVDGDRQSVPIGEIGEIAIRGGAVMVGYYNAEEATRETIDEDGWLYTGDLGTMGEDGYLRITGRKKDMIIRGGQNIYPAELEAVMVTHPKIHQVTVVGAPDEIAGEKVVAFVVPKEGETLSQLEVLNFCRENMAPYRVPGEVRFVDKLPLTPMGKVLKYVLREQLIAEMA